MTWLDWLGAGSCFLAAVAFLTWVFVNLAEAWPRMPEPDRTPIRGGRPLSPREPRSPMELYLEGGGDLSNPRVAALLAEAERGWNRRLRAEAVAGREPDPVNETPAGPLHGYEITPADAALIRMMHCAHFGPDATVTLPSGRTITGAEVQQWIDANGD